jgi:hypothetical protein
MYIMTAQHLNFGAILKRLGKYECIRDAVKHEAYMCPECNSDVIVKQGSVKRKHFAHKANCSCEYYTKPNESQQHREAKLLLASLLESRLQIVIAHRCRCLTEIKYPDNFKVMTEYGFNLDGKRKRADVAVIDEGGNIKYLFEVCHTHKTDEGDRPEPWFELSAGAMLKADLRSEVLLLNCMRTGPCMECERKRTAAEQVRKLRIQKRQQEEMEAELEWERMQETIRSHAKFMEDLKKSATDESHTVAVM